jgi:8-hydroxy-5-deazaflavin:NADPH oxidoreductase
MNQYLIGIIGAGNVAQTFARFALANGHELILSNNRGPETLRDVEKKLGAGARIGTPAQAAIAPIVLLAVPWPNVESALRGLPAWDGRILIDATNGFKDGTPAGGIVDAGERATSEVVASNAPGARVVKTFNTNGMPVLAKTSPSPGLKRVLFVSGDDATAKGVVVDLLQSFGFATVDLGDLHVGGRLQQVGGPIAGRDFLLAADD